MARLRPRSQCGREAREKRKRERGGEKNRRTNPHFSWLPTWSTWPRLKRMASPPKLVASSLHLRRASKKSAIPIGEETDNEDESRTGGNSRREDHQSGISSPWKENARAHRVRYAIASSGRDCAALFPSMFGPLSKFAHHRVCLATSARVSQARYLNRGRFDRGW